MLRIFGIKKLDLYMLRSFLGLFFVTFVICCFILVMQLLWMRINDIVGKGVEIWVLLEFLFYSLISVVPMALPLAILLASLMTFGNLGERFELTAMKSAGISLFRIMRPLTIFILLVCAGAFVFSNSVLPRTQVKFWTLVFSLRLKSPELDIPAGEFYKRVKDHNIYVRKKDSRTGLLHDLMIYDYSNGFQNASVTVADSGRINATSDHKYLVMTLYHGESFENLNQEQQRATHSQQSVPYRREIFRRKSMLIEFDTEFTRCDESVFSDQHVSKDMASLLHSIDSVTVLADGKSRQQSDELRSRHYLGRDEYGSISSSGKDTVFAAIDMNSTYATFSPSDRQRALQYAADQARRCSDIVQYNSVVLDDYQRYIRKHEMELHRKFTLSFACLVFFFIGVPLGAIIRKGGMGMPTVISVSLFIVYYIIDNAGYKMAREALWPVWEGMWLSSFVLLPLGVFLTYKAATDSALFNPEVWIREAEKIMNKLKKLHKQNGQD